MECRTRAVVQCESEYMADGVWCLFSEGGQHLVGDLHLEEWSKIPAIGCYGDNLLSTWGASSGRVTDFFQLQKTEVLWTFQSSWGDPKALLFPVYCLSIHVPFWTPAKLGLVG